MFAVDDGGSCRAAGAASSVSNRILTSCLYMHCASPAGAMRVDSRRWLGHVLVLVLDEETNAPCA